MKIINILILISLACLSLKTYADPEKKQVVVVGAGISGLGAAQNLQNAGYSVVILEAKEKIGGRINTNRSLGFPIELGANWIHSNKLENNLLMSIKDELNLKTQINDITAYQNVRTFDIDGEEIEVSQEDIEKIEFRIGLAAYLTSFFNPNVSLETIVMRLKNSNLLSFAPEALTKALLQVIELSAGEDAVNMSIDYLFAEMEYIEKAGNDEEVFGGFDQITDFLSEGLDVRLNSPVLEINYNSDQVEIFTDEESYLAEVVLVTVPLGALKQNLINFNPPLPNTKKKAIEDINLGNVNKVVFKFPYNFWGNNNIFFIERENRSAFSTWINNESMVNEPVIYSFISGDYSRNIEKESDDFIVKEAMKSLKKAFGSDIPDPEAKIITRWGMEPYILGTYSAPGINQNDYLLRSELSKSIDNKIFFAGEATSIEEYGFAHGALRTGIREAEKIKNSFKAIKK